MTEISLRRSYVDDTTINFVRPLPHSPTQAAPKECHSLKGNKTANMHTTEKGLLLRGVELNITQHMKGVVMKLEEQSLPVAIC